MESTTGNTVIIMGNMEKEITRHSPIKRSVA